VQPSASPAYRSAPRPSPTLARWRADLAEAEAVARRVRGGRVQSALVLSLLSLGLGRLLDAAGLVFVRAGALAPLRVAGHVASFSVGLGCMAVVAWWALRLRPALRADAEDLRRRAASLRAELPELADPGPFADVVYGHRLAALDRAAA
jgi:hypothetical protein